MEMVQTRSKTKKEVETKLVSKKTKSSKQMKKQTIPNPIDDEAMSIFMTRDYFIRHPTISDTDTDALLWEAHRAGVLEWHQKSASEKAPFIQIARERMPKPVDKPAFDHHFFSSKEEADAERATTKLGFKTYWDAAYADDLTNFHEHGHTGEVWFGVDLMEKVASWTKGLCSDIAGDQMCSWSVLDVGTGNGLLLQELAKKGFTDLTGSDYSEGAIDLARSLADRDGFPSLKFLVDDVLHTKIKKEFQLVVDKGTLDAIGRHPKAPGKMRTSYWASMFKLVARGGLLIITSCLSTRDSLVTEMVDQSEYRFESTSVDQDAAPFSPLFSYVGHIDSYSTYRFGGLVRSCVTSVAFQRN